MLKKNVVWFLACALLLQFSIVELRAQSNLTEAKKASVVFDVRLKSLRSGETMKGAGFSELPSPSEFDINKIERVFGALNLPQDLEFYSAGEIEGDLPMSMFVRIKFVNEAAAEEAFAIMKAADNTEVNGGVTYYKPPAGEGVPENFIGRMIDKTTIEMGTRDYLVQPNRKLFKAGLNEAWSKASNHNIRIMLDMNGEEALIDKALAMAKSQLEDPVSKGMLGMVKMSKNLRISVDPDQQEMINLEMTGKSAADAKKLQEGLNSLIALGKMVGGAQVESLPRDSGGEAAAAILNKLKANLKGDEVKISIARPENFEELLKGLVENAMMGMGGLPQELEGEFDK